MSPTFITGFKCNTEPTVLGTWLMLIKYLSLFSLVVLSLGLCLPLSWLK